MHTLSESSPAVLDEASGYFTILGSSLQRKSRFDNNLLYNVVTLCTEKLFVSLLMYYGHNATHHTAMSLYKEADYIKTLPPEFEKTVKLISRYESICLMDAFGYKEPSDEDLKKMILGLSDIKGYVHKLIKGENA